MSLTSSNSDTRSQTPTSDSVNSVLENLSTTQDRISTLHQDLVSIKQVLDEPARPRSRPLSTTLHAPDLASASDPPPEEEYTAWVDVMREVDPTFMIIQELMPTYKTLPREPRIDIKRGVRDWLMFHVSEQEFEDCIIPATRTRVQTFGIPVALLPEFRAWASCELAKCFRNERVLDA
ncbi:hypothetical protein HDU81_002260 [Chytriomyces hyalinus]|nr:hypothetical protein HDU81_002260 [Chytriomyces hyalinus]